MISPAATATIENMEEDLTEYGELSDGGISNTNAASGPTGTKVAECEEEIEDGRQRRRSKIQTIW